MLARYREYIASAPEELNVWAVLRKAPPLPFLPADVHGREVLVLIPFYVGEIELGRTLRSNLCSVSARLMVITSVLSHMRSGKRLSIHCLRARSQNYWKSHYFTELHDGALDSIVEFAGKLPSPRCEIFIGLIQGAPNRIRADATAYRPRDAKLVLNVHGRRDGISDDQRCIAWAREFFAATAPYASGGCLREVHD